MNVMKRYINLGLYAMMAILMVASCKKIDPLETSKNGLAPALTASTKSIAAAPADSMNTVLSFTWLNPMYSVDVYSVKYIIEIDSIGKHFSNAAQKTVVGFRTISFTAKELNTILLGLGFDYNKEYKVEARLISSHGNNNERLYSNTITLSVTPYVIPPKVTPPTTNKLFLVGSATAGGWNNPVPVPSQEFTRVDSVNYEGEFYMKGGQQYLCLPLNGNWDNKYSVQDNNAPGLNAGGEFGFNYNDNFPGPAKTGWYKIHLNFQSGKFTVELMQEIGVLYVPGDYQGWNPGNAPGLGSALNDGNHEGYVNIPSGGSYKFKLTSENTWSGTNYGDAGSGNISSSGGDITFPGAGFYKINANTVTKKLTLLKTTWGLIGSFNGWSTDVPMVYNSGDNLFEGTIVTTKAEKFKFRANGDWPINFGDNDENNSLEYGGKDISIASAGTYKVKLILSNPGYYTYKVTKQ